MSQDSKHDSYVSWIASEEYPDHPRVPLPSGFQNEAGDIINVLFNKGLTIGSVAIIESIADAIRSNHYHKTDWHFMYVVSGQMDYYWRKVGNQKIHHLVFNKGDLMFTPPMVEHATFFLVPTVLLTIARNSRKHDDHESDLVRNKLIEFVDRKVVVCE
jgi:uncharacterized RmlC-like cupin family protein